MAFKERVKTAYTETQDEICRRLEAMDGAARFKEDNWEREGGGGGRTRVIKDGQVLERGGVNFACVHGEIDKKLNALLSTGSKHFFATGVSIVLHPHHPFVPIIHMNIRYFELDNGTYYFGGGIDLTPHYVVPQDAKWFHQKLKEVCDLYNIGFYPKFKTWADNYFYLPHRNETRGVGGIFFDKLTENEDYTKDDILAFSLDVGRIFPDIYENLVEGNKNRAFQKKHKDWQALRRSRYVEFNLLYDLGTKFGLESNGRTESILMSMPPSANWEYNHVPEKESEEAYTVQYLKKGIDWVDGG